MLRYRGVFLKFKLKEIFSSCYQSIKKIVCHNLGVVIIIIKAIPIINTRLIYLNCYFIIILLLLNRQYENK